MLCCGDDVYTDVGWSTQTQVVQKHELVVLEVLTPFGDAVLW